MRTRTADDPDGPNDDAVEEGAIDHVASVYRSPSHRWARSSSGSGDGDGPITIVTVNPRSGSFNVGELRSVNRGNDYQAEDPDPILCRISRVTLMTASTAAKKCFHLSISVGWHTVGVTVGSS